MSGASNIIGELLKLANNLMNLGHDHAVIRVLIEKLHVLDDTLINKEQAIENYRTQIKELKERLNED